MIELTRFGGGKFVVNCELIETVEATPDTVVTMTNGHRYVVKEPPEDIIEKVVRFKRRLWSPPGIGGGSGGA
ncbi:flagellar FlbD family protein [Thermanaerovibrio acidaminovorans]|jgi:flagellar protein FlbD|uniref:flagellar FlbD family protein n=1 Tax=Thermanaerovibrio acidaminovorans TaxID=81462 RepID=UPI002492E877|nr:flagellar FlbD family protein [Thermanaerovibrio acidaminovorans]